MKTPRVRRDTAAFTLVELMVTIAVVAIVLTIAAPSFFNLILMQRLKSVNAQVVTDMQFARSEAASRNLPVWVRFQSDGSMTCYVLFTGVADACSCLTTPACGAGEIRTAQVRKDLSVQVQTPEGQSPTFFFDPATGGITIAAIDVAGPPPDQFVVDAQIDTARALRTAINRAGRPSVCAPAGSTMTVPACP